MLPLKNNEQKFGWPAQLMHWIMAVVIIGMICVGLYMVTLPNSLDKLKLYGLHKSTGILIFFFIIFRLFWRQINFQPHVPHENGRGFNYPPKLYKLMDFFAHYWHIAIYLMLFIMPITGWLMTSSFGFPVSVFGWFTMPNLVAPSKENAELFETIHDWTSYLLIFFIIVHILAGLFHHYILKDIVMKRMLPVIAIILFATPAFAAQKWEVDKAKSSIKFEAVQNGAPVVGEFKDYDAQIEFDPNNFLFTCKAQVTIKMDSVVSTYDEMISYLKMPEWFDVKKFPLAKFTLDKIMTANMPGYRGEGPLTIRGVVKPVILQFNFSRDDTQKVIMDGTTTIKRNDFGIGQGEWKDTSAVKDEVKVMVHIEVNAAK